MKRRGFFGLLLSLAGMSSVRAGDNVVLHWLRDEIDRRFPRGSVSYSSIDCPAHCCPPMPGDDQFRAVITTARHIYKVEARHDSLFATMRENRLGARLDGLELAGDLWRCEPATWRAILKEIEATERKE